VDSDGFENLATAMSGRLCLLVMSDCENLKDEDLIRLMKRSEGMLHSLYLANCRCLSIEQGGNFLIFGPIRFGSSSIVVTIADPMIPSSVVWPWRRSRKGWSTCTSTVRAADCSLSLELTLSTPSDGEEGRMASPSSEGEERRMVKLLRIRGLFLWKRLARRGLNLSKAAIKVAKCKHLARTQNCY